MLPKRWICRKNQRILHLACQGNPVNSSVTSVGHELHSIRQRCNGQPFSVLRCKNSRHWRITWGRLRSSAPMGYCSFSTFSLGQICESCLGGPVSCSCWPAPYRVLGSARNFKSSTSADSNFSLISNTSKSGCNTRAARNGAEPQNRNSQYVA